MFKALSTQKKKAAGWSADAVLAQLLAVNHIDALNEKALEIFHGLNKVKDVTTKLNTFREHATGINQELAANAHDNAIKGLTKHLVAVEQYKTNPESLSEDDKLNAETLLAIPEWETHYKPAFEHLAKLIATHKKDPEAKIDSTSKPVEVDINRDNDPLGSLGSDTEVKTMSDTLATKPKVDNRELIANATGNLVIPTSVPFAINTDSGVKPADSTAPEIAVSVSDELKQMADNKLAKAGEKKVNARTQKAKLPLNFEIRGRINGKDQVLQHTYSREGGKHIFHIGDVSTSSEAPIEKSVETPGTVSVDISKAVPLSSTSTATVPGSFNIGSSTWNVTKDTNRNETPIKTRTEKAETATVPEPNKEESLFSKTWKPETTVRSRIEQLQKINREQELNQITSIKKPVVPTLPNLDTPRYEPKKYGRFPEEFRIVSKFLYENLLEIVDVRDLVQQHAEKEAMKAAAKKEKREAASATPKVKKSRPKKDPALPGKKKELVKKVEAATPPPPTISPTPPPSSSLESKPETATAPPVPVEPPKPEKTVTPLSEPKKDPPDTPLSEPKTEPTVAEPPKVESAKQETVDSTAKEEKPRKQRKVKLPKQNYNYNNDDAAYRKATAAGIGLLDTISSNPGTTFIQSVVSGMNAAKSNKILQLGALTALAKGASMFDKAQRFRQHTIGAPRKLATKMGLMRSNQNNAYF